MSKATKLKTIGDWAFRYCSALTSITIPNSVTSIGDWAFYYGVELLAREYYYTK